jgi:hypothetical protein
MIVFQYDPPIHALEESQVTKKKESTEEQVKYQRNDDCFS